MKTKKLLLLFFVLSAHKFAQGYGLYSDDTLTIYSKYFRESIQLNLHLPETFPFCAKTTQYPVTVIFDSQHDRTYPQIINAMDLLTSEAQIPESIIIGIPFNMQNRRYRTSNEIQSGDTISGIEKMELFLFEEVLPALQKKHQANTFLTLVGHSRTAFLVNYLAFNRPNQVHVAVALSGFLDSEPLSVETFGAFLNDASNFDQTFSYYCATGTALEERNYWHEYQMLDSIVKTKSLPAKVRFTLYETKKANHMSNYWVALPLILMDAFSPYNDILDSWFHGEKQIKSRENLVQKFERELSKAGTVIGTELNPSITHIFSLASEALNDNENYETAIEFMKMGLRYYPNYLDFYGEIIEFYKLSNKNQLALEYKALLRKKTQEAMHLSPSEKETIFNYLDED
jgi:enterochelin esterase-like enzyme